MSIHSYVINLDKRVDRWEVFQQHMSQDQTLLSPQRISAITDKNVEFAILLSHQSIVKIAKDNNYDMVLALEDDCVLTPDFDLRFPPILSWLKANMDKWEIFNGGPAFISGYGTKCHIVDKDLKLIQTDGNMTHFIIYNSSVYDKILALKQGIPIDIYIHRNIKQLTTVPFLARQLVSYSDNKRCTKNYNAEFDRCENKLAQMLI